MNYKEARQQKEESIDRRQFLRSALKFGGVGLLLTYGSREILASSLTLDEQQLESIRRAKLTPGATEGSRNTPALVSKALEHAGGCDSCAAACEGGCTGTCTGGCTSCTGCSGCTAACKSGCEGSCSGGCQGGCSGHCTGCSGVNL